MAENKFQIPVKHYKPREILIAYKAAELGFLRGKCVFNFRIPPPLRPRRPGETEWEYQWWQFVRSKEIDCVCWRDNEVDIIEFKDRVRPSGIGQLITYRELFRQYTGFNGKINLIYICGEDDPQVRLTAEKQGIKVVVLNIPAYQRRYFRPKDFGLEG